MKTPHLDAFQERELLGTGPCGAVFRAQIGDGGVVAVKLLEGVTINRGLLQEATARLEEEGWPRGIMPVMEADFQHRPALRVTDCLADVSKDGLLTPRSLQHRWGAIPGGRHRALLREILEALAEMHRCEVSHGNLKPGNVFLDATGQVLLTDWCLGNMPGVAALRFSDALLYQPPEQLRGPGSGGADLRWDVFSFGVLAYRLLVGKFPRADASLSPLAPRFGAAQPTDAEAAPGEIAEWIEAEPEIEWPGGARDESEKRWRQILSDCLALDPGVRPSDAREVLRQLSGPRPVARGEGRNKGGRGSGETPSSARSGGRGARVAAVFLGLGAVGLGALLIAGQGKHEQERARWRRIVEGGRQDVEAAQFAKVEAQKEVQMLESRMQARLKASQDMADRLFAWGIEEGQRLLPPLDGRKARLKQLEDGYLLFLEQSKGNETLRAERARARLHLAEIALSQGLMETAASRLAEVETDRDELTGGEEMAIRLARNRLLLALLFLKDQSPQTGEAFAAARADLEKLAGGQADPDRVAYLTAVLNLNESGLLAEAGEEGKAHHYLNEATRELNRLAQERPESPVVRSELAACYLSSASVLDGMGELGDARGLRELAAAKLLELVKESPGDLRLREDLAACYSAIAESALAAGDEKNAEANAQAAEKMLVELQKRLPESESIQVLLAAQHGLMGEILRNRGESEAALEKYEEGLRMIEARATAEGAEASVRFRYAVLTWEKGRVLGLTENKEEEARHEERALGILSALLNSPYGVSRTEPLGRTIGYLLGDLGHTQESVGDRLAALDTFGKGVKIWEQLYRMRPTSEEYSQALEWSRQRWENLQNDEDDEQ